MFMGMIIAIYQFYCVQGRVAISVNWSCYYAIVVRQEKVIPIAKITNCRTQNSELRTQYFITGNNVPLVYVDSIKYLEFTFSRNHKDDDDMLRQMRTLYARSNRIVSIFYNCSIKVLIELGRNFCGSFYCSYLWSQYNKSSFSKIHVAYNNLYRKILHVSRRSSASKMFVDSNILNFEALLRKELFSFTSRLAVSTNSIIRAIENCWLKKYVIWKPCHIDKLII